MPIPLAIRGASISTAPRPTRSRLPAPVPAGRFWSFTVYDNQTRSMLETDQISAGLDSTFPDVKKNADGSSYHLLRPESTGRTGRQLDPDHARQGLDTLFRLYGPTAAIGSTDMEAGRHRTGQVSIARRMRRKGDHRL